MIVEVHFKDGTEALVDVPDPTNQKETTGLLEDTYGKAFQYYLLI